MNDKREVKKKSFEGVVVSNKMQKTVRVKVEHPAVHPRYKKTVSVRKFFMAHSDMELEEGDVVTIVETRPYSKNVKWKVISKK